MSSAAFTDTGYAGHFEFTSDNTLVDEVTGDLMYDLSLAPALFWAALVAIGDTVGASIRVVNDAGDTAYSFQVVAIDTVAETGVIRFDSSFDLSTSTDTTWRMYAGNATATMPGVSDTLGRDNVWESNTGLVAHMEEDPSGSAPQMVNSTGLSTDGSSSGSMTSGDLVSGKLASALDFDGSDDFVRFPDDDDLDAGTSDYWMSTWIFVPTAASNADDTIILSKRLNGAGAGQAGWMLFRQNEDTSGMLRFVHDDGSGVVAGSANTLVTENAWHHIGVSADRSGNLTFYLDGAADGTLTISGYTGSVSNARDMLVAARDAATVGFFNDLRIDEVRFGHGTTRSADWFSTRYNNENSPGAFWTTGAWVPAASGYRIYRRSSPLASPVLVATVSTSTLSYLYTGAPNTINFFNVKAVSACEVEDDAPEHLVRVAFDDVGALIAPTPNAPIDVSIELAAGGAATVKWSYRGGALTAEPTSFRVYLATGDTAFDFGTPHETVSYASVRWSKSALGTHAHGTKLRVIIGAVSAAGGERRAAEITAVADALGPDAVSAMEVTVV